MDGYTLRSTMWAHSMAFISKIHPDRECPQREIDVTG